MQPGKFYMKIQTVIPLFHHRKLTKKIAFKGKRIYIVSRYLGVGDDADDGAVFLHLGEIFLDLLFAILGRPFLGIFGEGLLLGGVPEG